MCFPEDAVKKPEDSNYIVDVLTRCVVSTNGAGKRTLKIVPLKEPGEPVVVSISISQVIYLYFSSVFIYKYIYFASSFHFLGFFCLLISSKLLTSNAWYPSVLVT